MPHYLVASIKIKIDDDIMKDEKVYEFPLPGRFTQTVNELMIKGYKPNGGVTLFFGHKTKRIVFFQSMYKGN